MPYLAQLTYLQVLALIIVFSFVTFYVFKKLSVSASKKSVLIFITAALLLTAVSLTLYGAKGGSPSATIYGWPKEIVHYRPADSSGIYYPASRHFYAINFLADLVFYFSLCFFIYSLVKINYNKNICKRLQRERLR